MIWISCFREQLELTVTCIKYDILINYGIIIIIELLRGII